MAKVEISIPKKKRVAGPRARRVQKKGPLASRRGDEELLRRRQKVGFLNFYDLGQISDGNGGWINNSYWHDPQLTVIPGSPTASDQVEDLAPFQLTNARDFENTFLSVGEENFLSSFRRIDKSVGNAFPLEVIIGENGYGFGSERWTPDGLRVGSGLLHGAEILIQCTRLQPGLFVVMINDFHTATAKVTNLPDFDAPPVTFAPKPSDIYFLVPAILQNGGSSGIGTGELTSLTVLLNHQHRMAPRFFEEPDAILSDFANTSPPGPTPGFLEAVSRSSSLSDSRTISITATGTPPVPPGPEPFRLSISPGGTFPPGYGGAPTFVRFAPLGELFIGSLTGIVKQGEQFYYFWHNP